MSKSKDKTPSKAGKESGLICSFCGKSEQEVKKIIKVGQNDKPICNECIGICTQILNDTK